MAPNEPQADGRGTDAPSLVCHCGRDRNKRSHIYCHEGMKKPCERINPQTESFTATDSGYIFHPQLRGYGANRNLP